MVLRTGKDKYTTKELGVFSNLETHVAEMQKNQAQSDRVSLTAQAVKNYSETSMTEQAIAAYAARVREKFPISYTHCITAINKVLPYGATR